MNFKIDPKKPEAIYLQIAKNIKELILDETFKEKEMLPSVRNLAFELRVNPNTVQRAYKELEREGWIEVLRGEGYVVKKVPEKGFENYIKEKKKIIEGELYNLKKAGFKKEDILNLIDKIWRQK